MKDKMVFFVTGGVLAIFALWVGGRVPYFLFYFFLLILLIPAVHGFLGAKRIAGRIKIPEGERYAGEEIKIEYQVENKWFFSLPRIEMENRIAYRLTGRREEKKIFALDAKGIYFGDTKIVCRRRGYYEIGEIEITIKDIFNLFSFRKIIKTPITLKVYPKMIELNYLKIIANQQLGELMIKDFLFQDYSRISDLRLYHEGDPFKKIHWKVSAKRGELMVKNFEQRGDTEVIVFIDSHMESYREDRESWLEDQGVEVALAVIHYCLKQNIQVSFIYEKHNQRVQVKGDNGIYLKRFLEVMVDFHPTGGKAFSHQIETVLPTVRQGTSLILVTPMLNKSLGTQGIQLKMKNLHPCYIVVGDEELFPGVWNENKKIGKKLEMEGIAVYFINREQDIRDVLEGKYEKGA